MAPLSWRQLHFSAASQILAQLSDCSCDGVRVVSLRELQIAGPYQFGDQLI
jgi:hypothetical protein